MEGFETVESYSDSHLTSSVLLAIYSVAGDSERKGKEREDSDGGSEDGS